MGRSFCIWKLNGRDDKIRTCDLTHPKGALYQAEPRPDADRRSTECVRNMRADPSVHRMAGRVCRLPRRTYRETTAKG